MPAVLIKTEDKDAGMRVDVFLSAQCPDFSRAQIGQFIKDGLVTINNRSIKASYKLMGGEPVCMMPPPPEISHIEPQALPLDILYSDDEIAVINKPKGLVVHPGAGVKTGTLCHALLYHFPSMMAHNQERPGIVHRLDKDTSGVIVIAKTPHALRILSQDFKDRAVNKFYRAFAYGEMQSTRFDLKTGHARHPHNRLRFFTRLPVPKIASSNVRMAHSAFEVQAQKHGVCSLKVKLYTGRTHQIRAHLADMNHPLLGDHLYGGARSLNKLAPIELVKAIDLLCGQALHAETIEFSHPKTRKLMSFTAPLPSQLMAIENYLY
ncbi:MAG: RluA family pseudouridine synthase [Myxococcales bacterium]|nr:RluA family pseudouridine synthase [Myxococcales bacterium]USN50151.1 MAG: RluA family pseudouridine synthase [Myxococcales bacterium]